MWLSLTAADVKAQWCVSPAEWEQISSVISGGEDAATSLVTKFTANTISRIRGVLKGRKDNSNATPVLGADGTLPDEMLDAALALIAQKFFLTVPGGAGLIDANREALFKSADDDMKRLVAGTMGIDFPTTPTSTPAQGGPSIEFSGAAKRQSTRHTLRGF